MSDAPDAPESPEAHVLRCDFCGMTTEAVRRVALDEGYDRLQRPHQERYACAECSEKKDRERQAAS